jgi:hypothetical protein
MRAALVRSAAPPSRAASASSSAASAGDGCRCVWQWPERVTCQRAESTPCCPLADGRGRQQCSVSGQSRGTGEVQLTNDLSGLRTSEPFRVQSWPWNLVLLRQYKSETMTNHNAARATKGNLAREDLSPGCCEANVGLALTRNVRPGRM